MGVTLTLVLALAVAACEGGDDETETTARGDGAAGAVVMEDISFQPGEITVPLGATVTWTNEDDVSHTTTSEEEVWDSGNMASGDSFSFTFEEPGTFSYICEIHPGQMMATVTVEE